MLAKLGSPILIRQVGLVYFQLEKKNSSNWRLPAVRPVWIKIGDFMSLCRRGFERRDPELHES